MPLPWTSRSEEGGVVDFGIDSDRRPTHGREAAGREERRTEGGGWLVADALPAGCGCPRSEIGGGWLLSDSISSLALANGPAPDPCGASELPSGGNDTADSPGGGSVETSPAASSPRSPRTTIDALQRLHLMVVSFPANRVAKSELGMR